MDPGHPANVRLDIGHTLGPDAGDPGHAVRLRSSGDLFQAWQLALVGGHDELAATLNRNAVPGAEGLHERLALAAQQRLPGPGRVVEAGVDHTAVVAGLMARQLGFLLEDGAGQVGPTLEEPVGGRQADDSSPDDRNVYAARLVRLLIYPALRSMPPKARQPARRPAERPGWRRRRRSR